MTYFIQLSKSHKLINIGRHRKIYKRTGLDRRFTQNRRNQSPSQSNTIKKKEQRVFIERRFQNERREGWVRTSRWASSFDDITA